MNGFFEQQNSDIVVRGGGITAVVAAVNRARAGADTILIPDLPFLGGTISESLLCRQKLPIEYGPITAEILSFLKTEKDGIIIRDQQQIVCDPEIIKWVLQELVVPAGVRLMFHTRVTGTDRYGLHLAARQGNVRITTQEVLDLRSTLQAVYSQISVCGFVTAGDNYPDDFQPDAMELLPDGRAWFAGVTNTEGEPAGLALQQVLDSYESLLQSAGRRLQLIPARPVIGRLVCGTEFITASEWERQNG